MIIIISDLLQCQNQNKGGCFLLVQVTFAMSAALTMWPDKEKALCVDKISLEL